MLESGRTPKPQLRTTGASLLPGITGFRFHWGQQVTHLLILNQKFQVPRTVTVYMCHSVTPIFFIMKAHIFITSKELVWDYEDQLYQASQSSDHAGTRNSRCASGSVKQDQHTGQYSDKQYLSHRVSGHPVFLVLLLVCTAMFNHTTSKRLRKAYSAVTRQFFWRGAKNLRAGVNKMLHRKY